jgi:hypothetical protein
MSRAQRVAEFEREDVQARESLELLFELKNAGGWHRARCVPSGRCSCERPATTTRKAS